MNQETRNTLDAAKEAVTRLLDVCVRSGRLYQRNPKVVAQVSFEKCGKSLPASWMRS